MTRITNIQVRRDSASTWATASINPILSSGEIGFETDTGKFKIGDGVTAWNSLLYATDISKITGKTITLGGNLTTSGANNLTFTTTGNTTITLPTSGTLVPLDSIVISNAAYTLNNVTTIQPLFNATNTGISGFTGALTVVPNTTYLFECQFYITGMSATSGNVSFDVLGGGTASFSSVNYQALGSDTSTPTTGAAQGGSYNIISKSVGNIVTAATGTAVYAVIKGVFKIAPGSSASGTIIPSIYLTTAVATAAIQPNAYFRATPIGLNTSPTFGAWS